MQKPDSLRAAIQAVLPELARDPGRLKMWIDKGRIRAPMTPNRDFAWAYTLNLMLEDFTSHPDLVFLAINDWLRVNQSDLLAAGAPGYTFEIDIIDTSAVDLIVMLELSEGVRLTPRDGGGWNLEHPGEPVLFPDAEPMSEPPSLLKQIWWKDELLLPEQTEL